jgi:hypothetical protein
VIPLTFVVSDGERSASETIEIVVEAPQPSTALSTRTATLEGDVRGAGPHTMLPPPGHPDVQETDGDRTSGDSPVQVSTGALTTDHWGVRYRSGGHARSLRFVYHSLAADPRPILSSSFTVPARGVVPRTVSARLTVGGGGQK